jgi:hypothetical protein
VLERKKKFRTALHAAIAYLIGMGEIESDSDVAEATGIEKGNLSSFKNGKKPTSNNFIVKFEDKYKINLKDFNPDTYEPYFTKKPASSQMPADLLTLLNVELKTMQASLDKLATAASVTLRPSPGRTPPVQDLGLGKRTGGKGPRKGNELKGSDSTKGI